MSISLEALASQCIADLNIVFFDRYFGDQEKRVRLKACEHASILNSLENLLTYPWIKKSLQEGKLSLSGWYFDFDQGSLLSYNPDTKLFEPLTHAPPSSVPQEEQQLQQKVEEA